MSSSSPPGSPSRPAQTDRRPLDQLLASTGIEHWSSRRRTSALLITVVGFAFLIWSANTTAPLAVILSVGMLLAITLAKRRFFPIPIVLAVSLSVPLIENYRYEMGQDFVFAGDWWSAVSLLLLINCALQYLHAGPLDFRRWRLTGRGDSSPLDVGDDF